jgi:dihydropteroate synthase
MNIKKCMELSGGLCLDFSGPALVMAVVNCNEDSFYAPSRALGEKAVEMALAAEKDGASVIDFGAESTRPGSLYISCEEELTRLIPVIQAFSKRSSLPVSVDTRKAAVARSALDAGANIINDISGLSDDPEMARLCAERGAAVVRTHKKGVLLTMQDCPAYDNLIDEIKSWFG